MRIDIISHSSGDQIPILLDINGLPIPTPNEFILGRRSMSTSTLVRNLRELMVLYRWLDKHSIDLWERIESGKFFSEAELRGSLVEALRRDQCMDRRVTQLAVSPHSFNLRVATIRNFFSWCFDLYLSSLALGDMRYERIRDQQLRNLKWLDTTYTSLPPVNTRKPKGLKEQEVKDLIECLDPNNPKSVGRNAAVKFRNYISTMIMLYYGLRPGELLSLKVEDIELGGVSGIHVKRRPPDPNDTRRPRPKIKRNGRILPIEDPQFARRLNEYIMTWRDELEAKSKQDSEYLILSDEGDPLSQSALNKLYEGLRRRFADQLPPHLSAKALRHTFSSRIERTLRESGLNEDRRRQALAILRGDSSLESQSVYIAQEIEEQAKYALKSFQKKLLLSGSEG